jgi:protein-arginine kinase activator protein McsA
MSKLKVDNKNFIAQCSMVHNNKYGYEKVSLSRLNQHINIICPIHGEFMQLARNHKLGFGCKKCGRIKGASIHKYTLQELVDKANKIHSHKYNYTKFLYDNIKTKSIIICDVHGEFIQDFDHHIHREQGCPMCARNCAKEYTLEEHIMNAYNIHNGKYDYSYYEFINMNMASIIICPTHGKFTQDFIHHIGRKQGCPKCVSNFKLTREQLIERSINIHGNDYDYSEFYPKNYSVKSTIICQEHGKFSLRPTDHIYWRIGCPGCGGRSSSGERAWLTSLEIKELERQKSFKIEGKRIFVDGFDPITNTIYEYNGDYWHGNPVFYPSNKVNPFNGKTCGQLYKETIDREALFKKLGFNVVSIWENEWFKQKDRGIT